MMNGQLISQARNLTLLLYLKRSRRHFGTPRANLVGKLTITSFYFIFGLQSSTHESSNIKMLEHETMRSWDLEAWLMEMEKRVHELEMRLQELETTAYTPATLDESRFWQHSSFGRLYCVADDSWSEPASAWCLPALDHAWTIPFIDWYTWS